MNLIIISIIISLVIGLIFYSITKLILNYLSKKPKYFINKKLTDNTFIISNHHNLVEFCDIINFENIDSVYTFFNNIRKDCDLNIIIITMGGHATYADMISYFLGNFKKDFKFKINIIIPFYAFSCGTMMILPGDNIYCNDFSAFTPIDTQLSFDMEGDEVFSVKYYSKIKEKDDIKNNLCKLIKEESKATYIEEKYRLNKILHDKKDKNKIIKNIFDTKFSHNFVFHHSDLKEMGLNIINNIPNKYNDLIIKLRKNI